MEQRGFRESPHWSACPCVHFKHLHPAWPFTCTVFCFCTDLHTKADLGSFVTVLICSHSLTVAEYYFSILSYQKHHHLSQFMCPSHPSARSSAGKAPEAWLPWVNCWIKGPLSYSRSRLMSAPFCPNEPPVMQACQNLLAAPALH